MPAPQGSEPLLQLDGIAKTFGAVRALKGVSFDLRAGEVHALLGENGAGKSTLIKVITGAHRPDSGTLRLAGEELADLTPARAHRLGIACIYQQPALFPDLTIAENLALRLEPPGPWRRVDGRGRAERARRCLDRLGVDLPPAREVSGLSMPEQQLVEIAAALGAGARVLILDEPTASLTRQEQERLFEVVRDLRRDGVGLVYISHRLEEIFALADRVTVLRDGQSVGTHPVSRAGSGAGGGAMGLGEAELIRLMVGRELPQRYPPAEGRPGAVRLAVRGLGGRAAAGEAGASLELRAGEVVGLAGLVGAGRTDLAHRLFGLDPAGAGEIRLDGVP
ncbi:MAG: sugar ABC transporter ATP-binding protein, partial [Verrucomicrobiota bacterium]